MYNLLQSVGFNVISLIVRAIAGVVLTGYLAHVLTPNDFGLIAFFIVAVQLSGGLSELGMRTSLVTIATPLKKSGSSVFYELLNLGIKLRVKVSFYVAIILLSAIYIAKIVEYYDITSIYLLLYGMAVGVIGTLVNYPLAIYRINEQFHRYSLIQLSLPLIRLILIWAMVMVLDINIQLIVFIFFISVLLYGVIVGWGTPWKAIFSADKAKVEMKNRLIRLNGWLGVAYIIEAIAVKLDIFIIKALMSSAELGIYFTSYQFVNLLFMLGAGFTFVLLPKLTHKRFENKKNLITPFIFATAMILSGVSSSFLFVFSPEVIWLIFGDQYGASIDILRVLVFAGFFGLLQAGSGQLILRYYSSRHLIGIALVNLLLNFILNIIFIPKYGLYGAAVSTVVAYMVICCYSWGVCFLGAYKEKLRPMDFGLLIRSVALVLLLFLPFVSLYATGIEFSLIGKIGAYFGVIVVVLYLMPIHKDFIDSFKKLVSM